MSHVTCSQGTGGHEVMLLGSLLHQVFEQVRKKTSMIIIEYRIYTRVNFSSGFDEFPWY